MKEVVIVAAVRTPIGAFNGKFATLSAMDLGVTAAKGVVEKAGIDPNIIDEAVVGNVLSAGLGQNVARQVIIKSGFSDKISAMTLNHVCGSGLRVVALAAQMIKAGDCDVVLAGGTESMTNSPFIVPKARWGARMGHDKIVDTMIQDGLWDAYNNYHMGITAENLAEKYNVSRADQDQFALDSQLKAEKAVKEGKFKDEIVPVEVPGRKGPTVVDTDEYPKFGSTLDALSAMKPAFKKDGTVTAGNASGINDGAAMVLVMSKEKADSLGLKPMATIKSYASAGVDPSVMGYGVVPASELAMKKAGLTVKDINLAEANEAFAAQALSVTRALELDPAITNVNGGAIALGHPIGASGTRILVTLLHEMKRRGSKYGLASLCIGGGMGTTLIAEM